MTDIRALELRVVQEAMKAQNALGGIFDKSDLANAIKDLVFACPECNAGGHTCLGDGKSIPHGAGSCGEHDETPAPAIDMRDPRIGRAGFCIECTDGDEDPRAWCDCGGNTELYGACIPPCCSRAHDPENCPARTEWVASTFLHIEKGDRLRIGEDEATVLAVSKLNFHVDNTDPYRPKPWEHVELRADVGFGMTSFPTGTPVEIWCDAERKAQLIMSEAGLKPRQIEGSDQDA